MAGNAAGDAWLSAIRGPKGLGPLDLRFEIGGMRILGRTCARVAVVFCSGGEWFQSIPREAALGSQFGGRMVSGLG